MSKKSNTLVVRDERDAESQLKALYGKTPMRAGCNATHAFWYVGKKRASMSRRSTHRDGNNQPLYMVGVE